MVFCPDCGSLLMNRKNKLWCRACNKYVETKEPKKPVIKNSKSGNEDLIIDRGGNDIQTNPVSQVECEKCGNIGAETWTLQTRSADEPTTTFFRCTKCNHTWREY